MSEKLCALRKIGGGTLKETTLWTNSAPTSSFVGQTVTLSDSMANYKYIKIKSRYSTSNPNSNDIILYADSTVDKPRTSYPVASISAVTGTITLARAIMFTNNTTVEFGSSSRVFGTGTDNSMCIPIEIIGMK